MKSAAVRRAERRIDRARDALQRHDARIFDLVRRRAALEDEVTLAVAAWHVAMDRDERKESSDGR